MQGLCWLINRWKKAEGLKLAAQSSYEELTSSLPGTYAYIVSVLGQVI